MPPIIDGHVHVFNVGFLPVEGVLRAKGVPRPLAHAVDRICRRGLEREPPGAQLARSDGLMDMLERELIGAHARPEALALDAPDFIARYALTIGADRLNAIAGVLTEVQPALTGTAAESSERRLGASLVNDPHADQRRQLDRLLREAARHAAPIDESGALEGAPFGPSTSARGIIDWVLLLQIHESRIVRAFPGAWDGGQQFTLAVHHMMDMAAFYAGDRPEYEFFPEQLRRMRAVAAHAPVPLIGFVAYDPSRTDAVARMEEALRGGFAGVKFYPPSGYRPIDNVDADLVGMRAKDVNARNVSLFRMCVRDDVPLFTHCTSSGMEARRGVTGPFSNPRHWRRVLETSGLEGLRLCFGHAGGQDGWVTDVDARGNSRFTESYAHEVVELCVSHPNVYCDFGYFDELLDVPKRELFLRRLESVVDRHGEAFARKCCYGTDWHLVSMDPRARQFPALFDEMLRASRILRPFADRIMRDNALAFLDLEGFLRRSGAALDPGERAAIDAIVHPPAT